MGCKEKFCGVLSSNQEVPVVTSGASGFVKATLKGHTLTVSGRFRDLSSPLFPVGISAAHIHGPSNPGQNSGVLFHLTITPGAGNLSGKFEECQNRLTLNDQQLQWLRDGLLYVNIHTLNFQNGELRSQLLPKEGDCCKQYVATLNSSNEVPPNNSAALGTVVATLNCRTLTLSGSFAGLSSAFQAAHVHLAPQGVNGPVIHTLNVGTLLPNTSGNLLRADNIFTLTKDQLSALKAQGLYINVHSVNIPSGEIRGQLIRL